MGSVLKFFQERLSGRRLKVLLWSVALGLIFMFLFSGKSHVDLETIAVSPDEHYIACFEIGRGHKIRCFHADGSLAFDFDSSDIDAGGFCTLWFENDTLCALFYRTDKIVSFSMDGTILKTVDQKGEAPGSPSFSRKGRQYVYDGDEIDVVYDKRSFFGYWFFDSERSLAITYKSGETKIVYSWTATGGVRTEEAG